MSGRNVLIDIVSGGTLRLDAGNMLGPVPRVVWQPKVILDDQHRISLDTNCLLVRTDEHLALIDTGYGGKAGERRREVSALEKGEPLVRNLAKLGVDPTDITLVILTHLHFDHVGGCTRRSGSGTLELVFPKAEHVVQRIEWEDAAARKPELAGSYFEEDFLLIEERGRLRLLDGDEEIAPSLRGRLVGGHTRGMQIIEIGSQPNGSPLAVAPADLVPSTLHLKRFWTLAYDQFPLDVRRLKPSLLGRVADQGTLVYFSHDIQHRQAYLKRDPKSEFVLSESPAAGQQQYID